MKLEKIYITNFRGIKNVEISFNEMIGFLVSDNNIGKTRILECINQFYHGKEEMEVKFTYRINEDDANKIKSNIKEIKEDLEELFEVTLKNKEYLYKDIKVKKLVDNKILGDVIYIPAVSDHNNETDISKTSTSLSKMVSTVLIKNETVTKQLEDLNQKLSDYIGLIKKESKDNLEKLDKEILFKDIKLEIVDKKFDNSQILKNNLQLKVLENETEKNINELGTGVQRSIVNSILKYGLDSENYILILYDEPETFLNIRLQRELMQDINNNKENTQYIIATHSPDIIYRNEKIFSSIIKLRKENDNICINQYDNKKYINLIQKTNNELISIDNKYQNLLSSNINETILAWWDRNRVNALFENKILIVEGPTEEIFIDMVCKEKNIPYISSLGKYLIPYFKILFQDIFGIEVCCMYDKDDIIKVVHKVLNEYIEKNINLSLELVSNFETHLGYNINSERRKPQEFLEKYFNGEIDNSKIEDLKKKIYNLFY